MPAPMHSQFTLLGKRRFLPYFLTQFLGAFNDNVYKNALIIFIAFQVSRDSDLNSNTLINLSAGLFILPFFLFSASAGQIADKYEKSRLIQFIKLLEILIMLCAAAAFYLRDVYLLIGVLFLMGTQSSLFGPLKYGILPQQLRPDELVGGNGLVQSGTFLAILFGTMTGGLLIADESNGTWLVSLVVVSIALGGYAASRWIPQAPAVAPELKLHLNPLPETWHNIQLARRERSVFLAILGISWFWFAGATYLTQLPNYTKYTLGGDESVVTLLLTAFSIGIGLGSLLCERLSGHKIELGLVPLGAIGLSLFGLDLYFAWDAPLSAELQPAAAFLGNLTAWRVLADIVLLGCAGGIYIVPLMALIQSRSEPSCRSRIIAANNIFNALMMVGSAIFAISLLNMDFSIPQLFLALALLNALFTASLFLQMPEFWRRFWIFLLGKRGNEAS